MPEENETPTLVRDERGLALRDGAMEIRGDFSKLIPRCRQTRVHSELLVKAAKVKSDYDLPLAIDATAGLGEDGLLLASAGFRVWMFERDETIAALLEDALKRAADLPELATAISRITLFKKDSIPALRDITEQPDVVVLDPMFPERRKSAAVKKKFQVIHLLEKPCADEEELLEAARAAKPRKIVIKRPVKGPYLADVKPSYSISGKAVRYDVIALPR